MTSEATMKFGLGQPVARVEDRRFLTGTGRYTDDIDTPGQLRAFFVRSPHPHARIRQIDASKARAVAGVLAIVTAADIGDDLGLFPCLIAQLMPLKRPDGSPAFIPPRLALTRDRVRTVGDPVAVVLAESVAAAREAAELLNVDYEPLAAVTATSGATKPGAPAVWDECPDNISFGVALGDKAAVDAAFDKADHVTTLNLEVTRVLGNPMETRSVVALYDSNEDRFTLYTGNQGPHDLRAALATVMGLPLTKLRVVSPDLGGGFGIRSSLNPELPVLLWAAKKFRRPVKWTADRSELALCDDHGRDNLWHASLALAKNGQFLALRVEQTAAMGAYLSLFGPAPAFLNLGTLAGVYRTPAIHVTVRAVLTNTPPIAPYRGAGRPEACYVLERLIDNAAAEMAIDRVDLRRRNMISPTAMPFQTGLTFKYDCGEFEKNMDDALVRADVAGFAARRAAAKRRGKLRGLGIANAIEQAAGGFEDYATIKFDIDGTATVIVGTSSHGQGHETVFRQIVAEAFALTFDKIRFVQSDTDTVPYGHGTFGSRSGAVGGSAIRRASDKVIEKARAIAAHAFEAAPSDVEYAAGTFRVAGTDRTLPLADVVKLAFAVRKLPPGLEPGLQADGSFIPPTPTYPNGCHVAEVEIDPETGATETVTYTAVDDVGTVMNPLLLEGQMHGGIAQGIGQIMMEVVRWDATSGQLLNGSFMDYAMPRAEDLPNYGISENAVPTKSNPLGVKGAGEAGSVGALPALMNAIVDALRPLGVTELDMPATPENVWLAIQRAKPRTAA